MTDISINIVYVWVIIVLINILTYLIAIISQLDRDYKLFKKINKLMIKILTIVLQSIHFNKN